ncbi:hypothetical protein TNCV_3036151 [Trichonephila clavipes]|nr:hypothetical protein TNCV_3036151 [Trichonephila clavipes]
MVWKLGDMLSFSTFGHGSETVAHSLVLLYYVKFLTFIHLVQLKITVPFPLQLCLLTMLDDRGCLVVKVTDLWPACHHFEIGAAVDPPCREADA